MNEMEAKAEKIRKTFCVEIPAAAEKKLPGRYFPKELYVLMQPGVPIVFYTQQCRALNLIWALEHRSEEPRRIRGKQVVVVGAGAAGLTAAVGAVLAGAEKVTVLEKANVPMSLQLGCEHRFLHPRFHEWPKGRSHSAAPALPFLTWSVGTAGEVASRLHAEFCRMEREAKGRLVSVWDVHWIKCKELESPDSNRFWVCYKAGKSRETPVDCLIDCNILIVAAGFGVETTVEGLSPRSYWRVDSLTQPSLGSRSQKFQVLVAGDGDGGTIDVLRACLRDFDQGPFIDRIMEIASKFPKALEAIREAERFATTWRQDSNPDKKDAAASDLYRAYEALEKTEEGKAFVDELTKYLKYQLREDVSVTWLGKLKHVTSPESHTLNRVLGWLVQRVGGFQRRKGSLKTVHPAPLQRVPMFNGTRPWRGYHVSIQPEPEADKDRVWDEVIVRYGAIRPLQSEFGAWGRAVQSAWKEKGGRKARDGTGKQSETRPEAPSNSANVLQSTDWGKLDPDADKYFWKKVDDHRRGGEQSGGAKNDAEEQPFLQACLPAAPKRETKAKKDGTEQSWWELHEIKIWIEGAPEEMRWVKYHLHPYRNGIQRRANPGPDRKFSLRIFTHDDYWVSAELSGGRFIRGDWLTKILERTAIQSDSGVQPAAKAVMERSLEGEEKTNRLNSLRRCAGALWKESAYEEFRQTDPPVFVDDSKFDTRFERELERNSRLKQNSE